MRVNETKTNNQNNNNIIIIIIIRIIILLSIIVVTMPLANEINWPVHVALLLKLHSRSYPCPVIYIIFLNIAFLLGITSLCQISTGISVGLHATSDINSTYSL